MMDVTQPVFQAGAFSPEECQAALAAFSGQERVHSAAFFQQHRDHLTRHFPWETDQNTSYHCSFLEPDPECAWLFEKIIVWIRTLNRQIYQFELQELAGTQLRIYQPGDFQSWQLDLGMGPYSSRKLCFVLQLSDPTAYQGGQLEVESYTRVTVMDNRQGTAGLIPSFLFRRILPVTAGEMALLVGWVHGKTSFR